MGAIKYFKNPFNGFIKANPIDLVEIESAGSGQGTVESSKSLVYLSQWNTRLITVGILYAGRYDDKLNAEDCRTGSDDTGYLNVMSYSPYVAGNRKCV